MDADPDRIPTAALAATEVLVPATVGYTFDLQPDRDGAVTPAGPHLDLFRDGTLVAMTAGRTFLVPTAGARTPALTRAGVSMAGASGLCQRRRPTSAKSTGRPLQVPAVGP